MTKNPVPIPNPSEAKSKKNKRVTLSSTERLYIWEHRQLYGRTCNICHEKIEKLSELELDHIKPFSKGGKIQALAHKECNRMKGNSRLRDVQKKMGFESSESKSNDSLDLKNEFEKLYGPIGSILNNVVCTEVSKAVLTPDEKGILDVTFSKQPFTLKTSQEEWRNHFHVQRVRDIDSWFVNRFIEEYENNKGKENIEKQFSFVYSMLKNASLNIEKVAILPPHEKKMIDKIFLAYPYMPSTELYNFWNTKIRTTKPTFENYMRHILTLYENLKIIGKESEAGLYLIPKEFVSAFLEESEKKACEYRQNQREYSDNAERD